MPKPTNWTPRNRFTLRVAAAITGDDPWKHGFALYHGTYTTLTRQLPRITKEHGGNIVVQWLHHGRVIDEPIF